MPQPFEPYVSADRTLRELSALPLLIGTLLGMVFGASSLYLVLKVGLTVSASIPVAVLSITLFKILHGLGGRDATILQNNITQTAGSAGESIAFGVGVTMPAIMILGFDLEIARITLVTVLGGLLGILMMIPLRRALIVQQHGTLKYPEGTACAEVLKAGASVESRAAASAAARAEIDQQGGAATSARTIFAGFGIGMVYQSAMVAFKAWRDVPEHVFGAPLRNGSISAEISPALLGVGYIIGPKIASTMCAGGVLAYLVLIPLIAFLGEGVERIIAPGVVPLQTMSHTQLRSAYILYIAAGAVATGGIISVGRALPMIWRSIVAGIGDIRSSKGVRATPLRTERDLSLRWVMCGILGLIAVITLATPLYTGSPGVLPRLLAAILVVLFGFLFVTVSSRLTGEIGSTSNPISGMTVATLILTCAVFLLVGWSGPTYYVTALSIGAIVCIAASNAGATSQDLKTGYLVGATPRLQQIAILIAALVSALVLGPILLRLNDAATVYVPLDDRPTLHAPAGELHGFESLAGPQGANDPRTYHVWYHAEVGGNPKKYLVDDDGNAAYLVDPGINGTITERPDGSRVTKFDAPKAALMSYIIKGILDRKLPWTLVLLGVFVAVVLEMLGVSSLPFAVGLYLPLSSSTPIFIGGLVRWAVDRHLRGARAGQDLTEEQLVAETDRSPGVLLSSGYVAGAAIAGIVIAVMAGAMVRFDQRLFAWASVNNPFFAGAYADVLSLLPFLSIGLVLYLTGRGKLFGGGH